MNDNDSRNKPAGDRRGPDSTIDETADPTPRHGRREPVFTDFDEEEDYEEAERDTDYAAAYEGEPEEEEDYLESLEEEDGNIPTEWQVLGAATAAGHAAQAGNRNPWAVEEEVSKEAGDFDSRESRQRDEEDDWDIEDEDDDYSDEPEEFEEEEEHRAQGWPLGLIVVGIVALVLLVAGGYGVIQQRSATQEEIRQLQAALATSASPAEVVASRDALRDMEQRFTRSEATIDALTLENRRLTDTVAGLEKQLAAQQSALQRTAGSGPSEAKPTAAPPKAAPAPKPAPKPASKPAPKPAPRPVAASAGPAATATGDWFVNFSSYTQRSVAESWVNKLDPTVGKVILASAVKDGRTFYRVRVVGLADRAQAQKVAAELQATHRVPPLWVGRE